MPRSLRLLATFCAAAIAAAGLVWNQQTSSFSAAGLLSTTNSEPSPSRGDVLRAERGTYIGHILFDRDSTLNRWPDRIASPIRVWVEPTNERGFDEHVRSVFSEWVAVGLPLRFAFVDRARDAEIRVRWTDHLERKTGTTAWRVDDRGWVRTADVLLANHLSNGRPLDARSLHGIALHEVGHALGLGHSTDRHDIMAPLVRVSTLSDADRATARLLYAMPAGHIR